MYDEFVWKIWFDSVGIVAQTAAERCTLSCHTLDQLCMLLALPECTASPELTKNCVLGCDEVATQMCYPVYL